MQEIVPVNRGGIRRKDLSDHRYTFIRIQNLAKQIAAGSLRPYHHEKANARAGESGTVNKLELGSPSRTRTTVDKSFDSFANTAPGCPKRGRVSGKLAGCQLAEPKIRFSNQGADHRNHIEIVAARYIVPQP